MATIAKVTTGTRTLEIQDRFTARRIAGTGLPPDAKIEFVKEVHNVIGVSGSWCGNEHGYHPWVVVKVDGVEKEISTYYLTH